MGGNHPLTLTRTLYKGLLYSIQDTAWVLKNNNKQQQQQQQQQTVNPFVMILHTSGLFHTGVATYQGSCDC